MKNFEDIPPHLVSFFSAEILSLYANQPDKYKVETDYFSGEIETASHHFEQFAESTGKNVIGVKFGFRTRKDGDLALAVWMPDLNKCSSDEQAKWQGLSVPRGSLITGSDVRFEMWFKRYIEGSWNVENGAIARIREQVSELNALTICAVELPLFKFEKLSGLIFPTAQNNHRYHDAHSEAYKLLVDGLNKDALVSLGGKFGVALKNPGSSNTVKLLVGLLPAAISDSVLTSFEVISKNRRLADHQDRPAAERMEAFEQFNTDLTNVEVALGLVKAHLAESLKVTVDSCVKRRDAMSVMYPSFDQTRTIMPNYSICDIEKVKGKTIVRVEFGERAHSPHAHNSELIILHFDDASSIAIHAASNFGNLTNEQNGLKPDDLNVSFLLNYVPPLQSTH